MAEDGLRMHAVCKLQDVCRSLFSFVEATTVCGGNKQDPQIQIFEGFLSSVLEIAGSYSPGHEALTSLGGVEPPGPLTLSRIPFLALLSDSAISNFQFRKNS